MRQGKIEKHTLTELIVECNLKSGFVLVRGKVQVWVKLCIN